MSNHYHLCVKTPEPNLVEGMRWLQSTFANRFNRFRNERGHVFQGRYHAIILDGDAVDATTHYIHLNPARAGIVAAGNLERHIDSSFAQLWYPSRRWSFCDYQRGLTAAGGLNDTRSGRTKYREYLGWLAESDAEKKRQGFDQLSTGWLRGSDEFKESVIVVMDHNSSERVVEKEGTSIREARWERELQSELERLGKRESELAEDRKGADWKVELARNLRESLRASNSWIATRLSMGRASSVQSLVSRHRQLKPGEREAWSNIKS